MVRVLKINEKWLAIWKIPLFLYVFIIIFHCHHTKTMVPHHHFYAQCFFLKKYFSLSLADKKYNNKKIINIFINEMNFIFFIFCSIKFYAVWWCVYGSITNNKIKTVFPLFIFAIMFYTILLVFYLFFIKMLRWDEVGWRDAVSYTQMRI